VVELSGTDDVDCFSLQLREGDVITAMTAPLENLRDGFDVPDTLIGLLDSSNALLASNDDGGLDGEGTIPELADLASDAPLATNVLGSALVVLVPADGIYYLGVSGFGDLDFDGRNDGAGVAHGQSGAYALLVSVVSEPAALILWTGCACAMLVRRRAD
jgi:hypothetical protein